MFAVSTWCFFTLPLVPVLKFLRSRGIQVIELWCDRSHLDPFMSPIEAMRRVVEITRELGIEIRSLHIPCEVRIRDMNRLLVFLDEMSKLGSLTYIILHPQSDIEVMKRLAEEVHSRGIRILLENSMEFGDLNELLNLVKLCGLDGLCLDLGHLLIHYGVIHVAKAFKYMNQVKTIHLHDNDSMLDLHLMVGSGVFPYHVLCELVKEFNPQDVVTEVYYGYYGDDPSTLVDKVKRFCYSIGMV